MEYVRLSTLFTLLVGLACSTASSVSTTATAKSEPANPVAEKPTVISAPISPPAVTIAPAEQQSFESTCKLIQERIDSFKWEYNICEFKDFKTGGYSVLNRPLLYAEFGDPKAPNRTLVLSMVHGDEATPLYIGLKLIEWLQVNGKDLQNTYVVVAPLVNVDGFLHSPRTRPNANGVDLNRNLPTADWNPMALMRWKKYSRDRRRYPGDTAGSEPETKFQQMLISQVQPQKIISIHSPYNFLDYDGPDRLALDKYSKDLVERCEQLKSRVKAIPGRFYPGSLGNFAGNERGIPTFTLELPSENAKLAKKFWDTFEKGIKTVINFEVPQVSVTQSGAPSLQNSN